MLLWFCLIIFLLGCVGGLVSGIQSGELALPHINKECNTLFLGIVGQVIIGGVGALIFWGLYGPMANEPVMGTGNPCPNLILSFGDLFGSVLSGIGGPKLLHLIQAQKCSERINGK